MKLERHRNKIFTTIEGEFQPTHIKEVTITILSDMYVLNVTDGYNIYCESYYEKSPSSIVQLVHDFKALKNYYTKNRLVTGRSRKEVMKELRSKDKYNLLSK